MKLRKGMKVQELTKRVGRTPREGVVLAVKESSVEVRWSDGHVSSVSGPLIPVKGDSKD